MERRTGAARRDLVGSGVLLMALAPTAVAVGLASANGIDLQRAVTDFLAVSLIAAVTFGVVGALVVARGNAPRMGAILAMTGALSGVVAAVGQYARFAVATAPGSLPGAALAGWLNLWLWMPIATSFAVLLPMLYPTGAPPTPSFRRMMPVVAAATAFLWLYGAVTADIDGSLPEFRNPLAGSALAEDVRPLAPVALASLLVLGAVVAAALITRYRRASEAERDALKWPLLVMPIAVAAIAAPALLYSRGYEVGLVAGLGQAVAIAALAAAIGVAMLRHRLFDVDLLISRTLLHGGLTLSVIGLYVAIVGGASLLLRSDSVVASLLATAVIAVVVLPLHARLRQLVNRLVYGQRDDPYAVLSALTRRLETVSEPRAVLASVAESAARSLRLPYAAVAVRAGTGYEVVAAYGRPGGTTVRLPLVHHNEIVGALIVSPCTPGAPLDPADRRLLTDLAGHASTAAHVALLNDELRRSRERVVTAHADERRRLRRYFHDDVGPALSSVLLKVAAARRRLGADPAVDALLAETRDDLRLVVSGVRRLAYDLRPPELDELGLAVAIREHAERLATDDPRGGAVAVHVQADALPPLPAAVEVAALRIAQQALANVVRHACAGRCDVRLLADAGTLRLEVEDDGVGLGDQWRAGVGILSMRERAEEVGGSCSVERRLMGGTRVIAALPLATR